ncbi:unnamed protein product [Prorocentrum cordatum]|uniref:Uncharacterized protein n=1 Tax=Prorocentrum cordatum TaxID=2364126 RepID=A0ABN9WV76_9DINO|nr:unnamed protein product [Polarella glacialis]
MGVCGVCEHSNPAPCPCGLFASRVGSRPLVSPNVANEFGPDVISRLPEKILGEQWLCYKVVDEEFQFGCSICAELAPACNKDIFATFSCKTTSQLRPCRLKVHETSDAHVAAVGVLLYSLIGESVPSGVGHIPENASPSSEQFQALLKWMRDGGAISKGVPAVGTYRKCKKMIFCLAEGNKRMHRAWLKEAVSVNILRDERHSRLLVRFRCADAMANHHIGVMGQPKVTKGTSTNISSATDELFKQFATKNFGAPYIDPKDANIQYDEDLYNHMRISVHALTVDAASNEVASAENMMSNQSVISQRIGQEAFAPNLKFIIRDKAHASRRILQRPWACDAYLSFVASCLITESSSIAQLIQHSDDLRAIYTECSRKSSTKVVSSTFSNMRAAKRRFESMCTPLSRICLDWEACFSFLARVVVERQGTGDRAFRFAKSCLINIDEELMLQAAMLADAADECMCLIRFFDTPEPDSALVCKQVADFTEVVHKLFCDGHVFTVEGHTQVCLKFLQDATHFMADGELRSVGGPRAVTAALRDRVLRRMTAWAHLAVQVVRAEHPDFEIISSFCCFDLNSWVDQTARDFRRHGRPKHFDESLGRIASSIGLSLEGLISEYFDSGRFARSHFLQKKSSNLEAWRWALRSTSSAASRKRHVASNLEMALVVYSCFTSSDSIIEHNFSRIQSFLGDQRLNAAETVESDTVVVLLSEPQFDDVVLERAKDTWKELYKSARDPTEARSDKGAPRPAQQLELPTMPSEKGFLEKRRQSVADTVKAHPPSKAPRVEDLGDVWTDKHRREVAFNLEKQQIKMFESIRAGTVRPEEVTQDIMDKADEYFKKVGKNMVARERREKTLQQIAGREYPSRDELAGLKIWAEGDMRTPDMMGKIATMSMELVDDYTDAIVIITNNPGQLPREISFAAGFIGAWIMQPSAFITERHGVSLKLKQYTKTRRAVFITEPFKVAHPAIVASIRKHESSQFTFLPDIGKFAIEKDKAIRGQAAARVIALITEGERHIFANVQHVYNVDQCLKVAYQLDLHKSCPGAG